MNFAIAITIYAVLLLPLGAQGAQNFVIEQLVHPSIGVLKFEFLGVPPQPETSADCPVDDPMLDSELVISDLSGRVLQRLDIEFFLLFQCRGSVSFVDLNDDGYMDLLIGNQTVGAFTTGPVYIYDPTRKIFERADVLSNWGLYEKATRKGCVNVSRPIGRGEYAYAEYCFDTKTRRWKEVAP